MTPLEHILVVDDDRGIRSLLAKFLMEKGYVVSTASDIKECEDNLKVFLFDLVILDTVMPGESGIEFLKRNGSNIGAPVIMLTALSDVDDRVNGLESGADDYLAKPFDPKELLLRIQKILRRSGNSHRSKLCDFGDYTFDIESGKLRKAEDYVHLTTNESKILQMLARRAGKIVARDEIVGAILGMSARAVDVAVARIRLKLEKLPRAPEYLQTVRNQGYVLWGRINDKQT